MASRIKDTVYDEMLCFIGEPTFQVPVRSFMDEHCLIFDPDIETTEDHRIIHNHYKKMVNNLIGAFCSEADITREEAFDGIARLNKIPDLHDMFFGLFEQVLAGVDFRVFFMAMAKHNLLIQEQVLAMILATMGYLPDSLTRGMTKSSGVRMDKDEEEIMQEVIRQQKHEADRDGAKVTKRGIPKQSSSQTKMSNQDILELNKERELLELKLKRLAIESGEIVVNNKRGDGRRDDRKYETSENTNIRKSHFSQEQRRVARDDDESDDDDAYEKKFTSSAARKSSDFFSAEASDSKRSGGGIDEADLRRRQEFLRAQRDKLLALKKAAREDQLSDAERSRPSSSRNSADDRVRNEDITDEERQKIAMRKAIAERLREEVVDKPSRRYN